MKDLGLQNVPVEIIKESRFPMREAFVDPRFVQSIKDNILSPPMLNKRSNGDFEIIFGNRRVRGAVGASLESIECRVVEATDEEIPKMVLQENLLRENPTPMETAAYLSSYMTSTGKSVAQVAKDAHLDRTTVTNLVRIYNHPVMNKEVLEGHYSVPAALLLLSREPDPANEAAYSRWLTFIDKHSGMSYQQLRVISANSKPKKQGMPATNNNDQSRDSGAAIRQEVPLEEWEHAGSVPGPGDRRKHVLKANRKGAISPAQGKKIQGPKNEFDQYMALAREKLADLEASSKMDPQKLAEFLCLVLPIRNPNLWERLVSTVYSPENAELSVTESLAKEFSRTPTYLNVAGDSVLGGVKPPPLVEWAMARIEQLLKSISASRKVSFVDAHRAFLEGVADSRMNGGGLAFTYGNEKTWLCTWDQHSIHITGEGEMLRNSMLNKTRR
ncbi:MAG: ParB/RepB/Spo0J family partition protein [Thaumarchaeota archaeon]|nr:ParB/RepB/Spo0J family partition protein [Nitrososphaerota archaeon]